MANNVDRVLVEIVTAANMAGVEQAKKGMLGLNVATVTLGAALGAIIIVGKAAIENSKAQEEAANLLTQAYASQGQTYGQNKKEVDAFLESNRNFIANQYDTEAAMAQVVRSGEKESDAIRILGDSLDVAAIKHEDVSVAATSVIRVLAGNSKALKEVGITTKEYNEIMKSTLTTEEKHSALLDLIESKYKGGRGTIDAYTQSQNSLNKAWQDATGQQGGPLVTVLTKLNEAGTTGIEIAQLYTEAIHLSMVDTWNTAITTLGYGDRAIKGATASMEKSAETAVATGANVEALAAAEKDLADAIKGVTDAIKGQDDANLSLLQSEKTLIDDGNALIAAYKLYRWEVKQHGKDSATAKAALLEYNIALAQQRDDIDKLVIAAGDKAKADDIAAGKTDTAADSANAMILKLQELEKTVKPGSALYKHYQEWIALLASTPGVVSTTVTVHGRGGGGISGTARAAGGPVSAGSAYTVGEHGPETLVMGSQGGNIIPNGAGGGGVRDIHIHIDQGAYIDGPGIDILTMKIAQRLRTVPGF